MGEDVRFKSLVSAAFAFLAIFAGVQVAAQTPEAVRHSESLNIENRRPIADVLQTLEEKYGLNLTYEDPEYVYASDLQDIPQKLRERLPGTVPGPRGGRFQFSYFVTNRKPEEDIWALLLRIMHEYAAQGGPVFNVQERQTELHGTEWHVIPVKWRNERGELVEHTALLDSRISLPLEKRSGLNTLSAIVAQLSHHLSPGQRVALGRLPSSPLTDSQIELSATNQPARDVLAELLGRLQGKSLLVWDLVYVPGSYSLSVHAAQRLPENAPVPPHPGSRPIPPPLRHRIPQPVTPQP